MRLVDHLDKGASLDPDAPCLTMDGRSLSYADVQAISHRAGRALAAHGIDPGDKVAVLSANDARAFSLVFAISRAGAVWCPVNPRNEAEENAQLLALFGVDLLLFHSSHAPLVDGIARALPALRTVCLDDDGFEDWLGPDDAGVWERAPVDDVVMLAGTGGTTGLPKGVPLTGTNLQVMTSIVLMRYPVEPRPTYLAVAPLTHAAGVLTLPVMATGGETVVMARPDLDELQRLVAAHGVTHTFLPPTLVYMLLDHERLDPGMLSSLRCLWYGAAPMSPTRLAQAIEVLGPVMAQLYGQTEAPMMIATMSPEEHLRPDGTPATERFGAAGRPAPLVMVRIVDNEGVEVPRGTPGEIVVRGPLVMPGYHQDPEATAEATTADGWHRTGDIGVLSDDGWLSIVDRAKDMIITGGYNVFASQVEHAIMQLAAVRECAVVGVPDDRWGERVAAVLELHDGAEVSEEEVVAHVRAQIGSVKAPKQVEVWTTLPRSTVGKVVKADIRAALGGPRVARPSPDGRE